MLVSVIIPVYNCEKTVETLYHSLKNQTYQNLEIIFVENGSTDHSYEILKKIEAQDHRVKVLRELQQGVSFARKAGWKIAQGKYLYFADGDDYILPTGIETLLKTAIEYQADQVIGSYFCYHSEECLEASLIISQKRKKYEISQSTCMKTQYTPPLWAHLYKKALIKEDFFVPLQQMEDHIFNWYTYISSKKTMLVSKEVYLYNRQEQTSLSSLLHVPSYNDLRKCISDFFQYCLNQNVLQQYEEDIHDLVIYRLKKLKQKYLEVLKECVDIYSEDYILKMIEELEEMCQLLANGQKVNFVKKR